jgi:hypothetical protein
MSYIIAAITSLFCTMLAAIKVKSAQVKAAEVKLEAATNAAKSAASVMKQRDYSAQAVNAVKEQLKVKQQSAQAKIDSGLRDDFDTDGF